MCENNIKNHLTNCSQNGYIFSSETTFHPSKSGQEDEGARSEEGGKGVVERIQSSPCGRLKLPQEMNLPPGKDTSEQRALQREVQEQETSSPPLAPLPLTLTETAPRASVAVAEFVDRPAVMLYE